MTSKPVAFLLADLGVIQSHSRPHVSNDNPYSEAQFKTLKYRPGFPARFGSIEAPGRTARSSSPGTTRSTGTRASACTPPPTSTTARAAAVQASRARVLTAAYHQHPERFVRQAPGPATPARHLLDQPAERKKPPLSKTPQRRLIQVDRFRSDLARSWPVR